MNTAPRSEKMETFTAARLISSALKRKGKRIRVLRPGSGERWRALADCCSSFSFFRFCFLKEKMKTARWSASALGMIGMERGLSRHVDFSVLTLFTFSYIFLFFSCVYVIGCIVNFFILLSSNLYSLHFFEVYFIVMKDQIPTVHF